MAMGRTVMTELVSCTMSTQQSLSRTTSGQGSNGVLGMPTTATSKPTQIIKFQTGNANSAAHSTDVNAATQTSNTNLKVEKEAQQKSMTAKQVPRFKRPRQFCERCLKWMMLVVLVPVICSSIDHGQQSARQNSVWQWQEETAQTDINTFKHERKTQAALTHFCEEWHLHVLFYKYQVANDGTRSNEPIRNSHMYVHEYVCVYRILYTYVIWLGSCMGTFTGASHCIYNIIIWIYVCMCVHVSDIT